MNEPMSASYRKVVEDFKKWADNSLGRCEDFSKGITPRSKFERAYELEMSAVLKSILDDTFNYASNRKSNSVR